MDIEKTIEFILQAQAQFEARMQSQGEEWNRRLDRLERQIEILVRSQADFHTKLDQQTDALTRVLGRHQTELDTLTLIVKALADSDRRRTEEIMILADGQRRLEESQRRTDERFEEFLQTMQEWMRRGGNGRGAGLSGP